MSVFYRIVKERHAEDAFTGKGAQRYGGRWNPPGYPVVYASQSRALAILEMFVHLTLEARSLRFLLFEIRLPGKAPLRYEGAEDAWRHGTFTTAAQEFGRRWLEEGRALALSVPSVIVPQERNIALNVGHPQFAKLRISRPVPFSLDERVWKA